MGEGRLNSLTHSLGALAAVRCAAATALVAVSLVGQHIRYATHDWELQAATGNSASAAWSDVKTPGDGRTYSLGSARVTNTRHQSVPVTFSGVGGTGSSSPTQGPGIANGPGACVAVLQVTDVSGSILWQRFFHGDGGATNPTTVNTTRGRSVSVFPGATELETRIAICGETFDQRIPPFPPLPALAPESEVGLGAGLTGPSSGFIAVYNGLGNLLWSHLLFGADSTASTTVTDISIRVDVLGGATRDVVTYCGVSTNGRFEPSTGPVVTPLTPDLPFGPLSTVLPCPAEQYATGDANNHPGESLTIQGGNADGFVGRVVFPPITPPADPLLVLPEVLFHSIVGGDDDDSLWGLVEKSPSVFAVVGTTKIRGLGASSPGWSVFPLTQNALFPGTGAGTICLSSGSPGDMFGVIVEFDAQAVPVAGLVLQGSRLIGRPNFMTVARDVALQGGEYAVVGSTTDPGFDGLAGPCTSGAANAGFLVMTPDPNSAFTQIRRFPIPGDPCISSGLTGVAGWNEHPDHLTLYGWTQENGPDTELLVMSVFRDTTAGGVSPPLQVLRRMVVRTDSTDMPGSVDGAPATFPTAAAVTGHFAEGLPLGNCAGGGVAVDPSGRVTVVASTSGDVGFPVISRAGVARGPSAALPAIGLPIFNGIMARIDMLPIGACRSDGTGFCPTLTWGPDAPGGTTPACALSRFGNQVGVLPGPALERMLLDLDGELVAGQTLKLIVDRPPPTTAVIGSVWHLGFPVSAPVFLPDHDIELWYMAGGPPAFGVIPPSGASIREVVNTAPLQAGFSFMVQYVCLLAQPLVGTPCPGTNLSLAASPALVFSL